MNEEKMGSFIKQNERVPQRGHSDWDRHVEVLHDGR